MASSRRLSGIRPWSRLRTRIALSYVAVTLLIVLMLESLVVVVVYLVFTYSPITAYFNLHRAGQAAQVFALQAALHADGSTLNPDTTFEPDQPTSLRIRSEGAPPELSWFNLDVPYVPPGTFPPTWPAVAVLIGPDERVVASSYPDRYPVSTDLSAAMPEEIDLIRAALQGTSEGEVREASQGRVASVAQTVWSRDQQPIGAVLIQAPTGGPPDTNLVAEVASVVIPSGLVWLCLMLPIGMVFGFLTTRGLIRRIERLAGATARFREGDTSTRVPVARADEIGQLEQQFNQMAEQIVESFEQRRALAEQSARREERARIEQELSSAHYIQRSLLPEEIPSIPGWQIRPLYRPAREVGGDLYDFLSLPDGRMGIVIGDANGKGVPSALIMATTCAMLRAAASSTATPGEALALVNNLLQTHIPSGTFATCFYAILEPASGRMCFANAGHNIPYLCRNGDVLELRARGMPLGLMPEQAYPERETTIAPGDSILFYTDGLVEAHSSTREMFGAPRLKRLLQQHASADGAGDGIIRVLIDELKVFTGPDWEQEDDVTLLILKRMG